MSKKNLKTPAKTPKMAKTQEFSKINAEIMTKNPENSSVDAVPIVKRKEISRGKLLIYI